MNDLCTLAIVFALGGFVGLVLGVKLDDNVMKQHAVEHHSASFVITNQLTGETSFKWNDEL